MDPQVNDAAPRYPRDVPPLWFLGAVAVMVTLDRWWPLAAWPPTPWHHLGWLAVATSAALALPSVVGFRRAGTQIHPFRPVAALVVTGPYRITRNPMYLGLVTLTVGLALLLGSASPWVVPPMLWLALDRRFVRREEGFLRERLGAPYDAYCQRVRRWL